MGFNGGLPRTRKGNDHLFVVVDKFSTTHIVMPYKNTIKRKDVKNMLFEMVWVHFVIQRIIILDRASGFLSAFWTALWKKMDTKLKRSKNFHQ